MEEQDYHLCITVEATPQEAFESINNISKWWTENVEGSSQKLNDEFSVQFGDVHFSKQKLIEVVPGKRVVWLVTDSNLSFVKDKHEWTNTRISFQIVENGGKTHVNFTHTGLVPEVECYDACSTAWSQYINGSLFKLLSEGKGMPELKTINVYNE